MKRRGIAVIRLSSRGEESVSVPAYFVSSSIAVHRQLKALFLIIDSKVELEKHLWTITHIESGKAILSGFTFRQAMMGARIIKDMADWHKPADDIIKRLKYRGADTLLEMVKNGASEDEIILYLISR